MILPAPTNSANSHKAQRDNVTRFQVMGHKTLLPVDVVLNTLRFSPSLMGRYSGKFAQFQRDMLPSWRGEE